MSKTDKKKTIIGGSQTPPIVNDKVTVATPQPTTPTPATQETQPQPVQATQPAVTQPTPTAPAQPQTAPTTTPVTADVAQPTVQTLPVNQATPPATIPTAPNPNLLPTNNVAQPPASVPTPQYADKVYTTSSDVDARNQQLSGQVDRPVQTAPEEATTVPTMTIYATDKDGQVIYDEQGNPIPLDLQAQTGASPDVRALPIKPQTTEAEQDGGGIEFKGKRYNNYTELLSDFSPRTSDEDKAKQMRHERRNALISALGDGLSALSNLYFTTKGAPDQALKPGMTEAAKKRMDDLRAKWQAEKDKYEALMLKGIEMDQAQNNFNTTNAQKEREQQFKYQKYLETERPKALAEIEKTKGEIAKLERENKIGDATWEQELANKKVELLYQQYVDEFKLDPNHLGMDPAEYAKFEADKAYKKEQLRLSWANHNETVRHNKQSEKNDSDGKTWDIRGLTAGKKYHATETQVRECYLYLHQRNFVDGDADNVLKMAKEIQKYYSEDGGRKSDTVGGPLADAMLGGHVKPIINY